MRTYPVNMKSSGTLPFSKDLHPETYVSLSSDIAPEHREYERTSTAVISAFVREIVLPSELRRMRFLHMWK